MSKKKNRKIRAKFVIDIEASFDDGDADISTEGTLAYCLEEDLLEAGGWIVHSVKSLEEAAPCPKKWS